MTPLAQFYMSRGIKIKNVSKFIQYEGGAALKPFAEKVVKMRVEATHENDEAKSNTAKLYGNSGKFYICFNVYSTILLRLRKVWGGLHSSHYYPGGVRRGQGSKAATKGVLCQ